jgi:hypothetical protein
MATIFSVSEIIKLDHQRHKSFLDEAEMTHAKLALIRQKKELDDA